MKLKVVVPVVSAIVLVAAAACGWAYMNAQSQQSEAEPESNMSVLDGGRRNPNTTIVKAAKDIHKGQTIAPDDLEESSIPISKVPESALGSQSMAGGRVASMDIAQGTVLLSGHLAPQIAPSASSESTSESSATTAAKPHKKYGKHK